MAAIGYIEFEPIIAVVLFAILLAAILVRVAGVLGSRNIERFKDIWVFFKFSVSLSAIFTGLAYPLYLGLRLFFSPFIKPNPHLPYVELFQPWLNVIYVVTHIYAFSLFLILLTKMDFEKAKEYLVVKLYTPFVKSGEYFEGGPKKLYLTAFLIAFVPSMIIATPFMYLRDVVRGWEKPPLPLERFIPLFMVVYSVVVSAIAFSMLVYGLWRVFSGRYYVRRLLLGSEEPRAVEGTVLERVDSVK